MSTSALLEILTAVSHLSDLGLMYVQAHADGRELTQVERAAWRDRALAANAALQRAINLTQ